MALSGSQKAYLQARSGIARSGATRSNYYFPFFAVITIEQNGVPVDVTAHVAYNGWSISMNINDEIDTATLSLLPSLPFVPVTRSQVRIGFGSASNVQFAGVIVTIQRTRKPGPDPRFWYDLQCVDWLTVFDAHLVLADYPAQSATTTILDIVARFTRGNFTTEGVAPDMPVVQAMQVVNERPSTIVRRLTNLVGGGFYVDADRRLRAWSASIPSPIQESAPQPLTDTLPTLKQFRMTEDASQQRTRVWVEGTRTATLLGVPAAVFNEQETLPVGDASFIHLIDAAVHPNEPSRYMRVGTQYTGATAVVLAAADPTKNPPTSTTTAPVVLGVGRVDLADASLFPDAGWIQLEDQIVTYAKQAPFPNSVFLLGSGYGALQAPVPTGAAVALVSTFESQAFDRFSTPDFPSVWLGLAARRPQPFDTPVVLVSVKQDHTTAAAIALREDSDGFYEHLVQDGRFTSAGATARALAELANFAQPLVTYEWDTEDLNAEPGRMQHIALVAGTPVTADVRITNVDVRPLVSTQPPRRSVRATVVQPASVLDVWLDDTR